MPDRPARKKSAGGFEAPSRVAGSPEPRQHVAQQHGADLSIFSVDTVQWSGPLPPPDTLALYDVILPGSAERILRMAESQHDHRLAAETRVLADDARQATRGAWFGFILGMSGLVVALALGLTGHDAAAAAIGGVSLAALVGAFISGAVLSRDERKRKRRETRGGE